MDRLPAQRIYDTKRHGPVVEIRSTGGKLFSSCYALFSGVAFITNIGIILAPAAHRLFHSLHLDDDDDK